MLFHDLMENYSGDIQYLHLLLENMLMTMINTNSCWFILNITIDTSKSVINSVFFVGNTSMIFQFKQKLKQLVVYSIYSYPTFTFYPQNPIQYQ